MPKAERIAELEATIDADLRHAIQAAETIFDVRREVERIVLQEPWKGSGKQALFAAAKEQVQERLEKLKCESI